MRWMIYGANGYTGELIARNARGQGLKPILAGRREAKVAPLAEQEGLEYRVFSLDDPDTLADELADVDLVLHCAGPFSRTSRAMLEGCLKARTHYLDITGEVAVFEHVFAQAARVEQAGISDRTVATNVSFATIEALLGHLGLSATEGAQ